MFSKKEILILLLLIAICSVVGLMNDKDIDNKKSSVNSREKTQIFQSVFIPKTESNKKDINSVKEIILENIFPKNSYLTIQKTAETTKILNNPKKIPSIQEIIAEAENLSSDLKLNFVEKKQSQSCSSCNQGEESLKEILSSIGFSSWEEYQLSEQYQLSKQDFEENKDIYLKEDPSKDSSICATILATVSGGGCSCADPACYVMTEHGPHYHCLGPCCCVCCVICCR